MLPPELKGLWNEYEAAEATAPRAVKLARLQAFIDELEDASKTEWAPWALEVARQYVDLDTDIRIRMPLFRFAVFPALRDALERKTPGAARWLAGLYQHIYRGKGCLSQLRPEHQTQTGLLQEAIKHDPLDGKSRKSLIDVLAQQLQYAVHEVPDGVLFGHDGASVEQCAELQGDLAAFTELVADTDFESKYRDLVKECAYHFIRYPQYLDDTSQYSSYREYLAIIDSAK